MTYLVLHVRDFDFESDDGGRVAGATVTYLDPLTPLDPSERGLPPLQMTVKPEVARQLPEAPAYYELTFAQRRGKGGKAALSLIGARHIGPAELATVKG